MSEDQALELLEFYMNLVENQEEAIVKMGKIISKQATELAHLRNLMKAETIENPQGKLKREP